MEMYIDQSKLEVQVQTFQFSRKQHLYHTGDPAQSIFRVRDGLIRITRMDPEGHIFTLRHVVPGDFFGEEALIDTKRDAVAESLTRATIEAIDPHLINQHDLQLIMQSLSKQVQLLMDYSYHLQTGDLRQRVCRYLLRLSETPLGSFDEQGTPTVSATHELIAEGVASTRESVSKIISDLRADGLIESGYRSILLLDLHALNDTAHGTGDKT
jgi:CRP/FNR family transcriptional regulator, LitR-dependent transcriptional activator